MSIKKTFKIMDIPNVLQKKFMNTHLLLLLNNSPKKRKGLIFQTACAIVQPSKRVRSIPVWKYSGLLLAPCSNIIRGL